MQWLPWKFLIKRTARAYGIIDPISFLARLRRFAQPSEVQEPIELLRAGIVFHARGLINTKAIQHNLDWIWPFWVEKQFNPSDPSFIPRAFSFSHVNLTHRNWTAIGHPEWDKYPIIDPRGLITPFYDSWSLDFWIISYNGQRLIPSKLYEVKQDLALTPEPQVKTISQNKGQYLFTAACFKSNGLNANLNIKIKGQSEYDGWLIVALRPYNPEGIQFIEKITYKKDSQSWIVNNNARIYLNESPQKVLFSEYTEGDVIHKIHEKESISAINCKVGMATSAAFYNLVRDKQEKELELNIPLNPSSKSTSRSPKITYQNWSSILNKTAQLRIPDSKLQFIFDASVRTLLLLSAQDIVPGPYTYKRFWFRDACFMLNALLTLGLNDRCLRIINTFPSRQKFSGYFQSQEGEWDSNGQVLWIIDRFQQLTGQDFDENLIDSISKGARWIKRKRLSSKTNLPHAGLLPPGFSAEHLGPNDYYYWDNFWGTAGLKAAANIMKKSGKAKESEWIYKEGKDLEEKVLKSISTIPEKISQNGIPATPYRRLDAGAIGSMVADYPLQLFPVGDTRIINTLEFLLSNCFFAGGFFQDMIHSGINPYLTLSIAQTLLRLQDQRYQNLIKTVANLASPTGQWPEAVHPITGGGCMGDGQHGWASAEWIMMLRNLFIREENKKLILGSGIFPEWIFPGSKFSFGPTLTPFGLISVRFICSTDKSITVYVDAENSAQFLPLEANLPGYQQKEIKKWQEPITLKPIC